MNVAKWYEKNQNIAHILGDVMLVSQMVELADRLSDEDAKNIILESLAVSEKILEEKEIPGS